jgi:hypothetical protein
MLEEIIINKMVNLDNRNYFILRIYIIKERIILDMLSEKMTVYENLDVLPKTLEDELRIRFKRNQLMRKKDFKLLINGKVYKSINEISFNYGELELENKFNISKKINLKNPEFLRVEFESLKQIEKIKEIILTKQIDIKEYLIEQKHIVTIDNLKKPFMFSYIDEGNISLGSIIIDRLFYEDIEEEKKMLFSCKDNEKMLYGYISTNEEIHELEMFTADRLKSEINYTQAPMTRAHNLNNNKSFNGKLFIGFVEPEQEEVEIVLFTIVKKINSMYKATLFKA